MVVIIKSSKKILEPMNMKNLVLLPIRKMLGLSLRFKMGAIISARTASCLIDAERCAQERKKMSSKKQSI